MPGAPPSARLCFLRPGWDTTALHRKARNHAVTVLVLNFDRRSDPRREAGPGFVAKQLRGGQRTRGLVLAELLVKKRIVKTGARGVGGGAAIEDRIKARPVRGRQAHRARLATGVKLASGQGEGAQSLARGANGVH